MGIRLIGAAYHPHWATVLTHTERLVLVAMALSALDTPSRNRPAELYFGGEEALVIALDGDLPDHGQPAYRTRTRVVRKIISQLIAVGAIERVEHGHKGQRAVYRLILESWRRPL